MVILISIDCRRKPRLVGTVWQYGERVVHQLVGVFSNPDFFYNSMSLFSSGTLQAGPSVAHIDFSINS